MAIEHKNLTGNDLHEPKGIETATSGTVYVANGSGSGSWQTPNASILNQNKLILQSSISDAGDTQGVYFFIPYKASIKYLRAIPYATLTGSTDLVLSIYINGVLFSNSLTVTNAGSGAGQVYNLLITASNTISDGSIIEIRSNGGPDNSSRIEVQLELTYQA